MLCLDIRRRREVYIYDFIHKEHGFDRRKYIDVATDTNLSIVVLLCVRSVKLGWFIEMKGWVRDSPVNNLG